MKKIKGIHIIKTDSEITLSVQKGVVSVEGKNIKEFHPDQTIFLIEGINENTIKDGYALVSINRDEAQKLIRALQSHVITNTSN